MNNAKQDIFPISKTGRAINVYVLATSYYKLSGYFNVQNTGY